MVSSFIKRMARIAMFSPPPGILMVLPIIFNLLRQHPTCIRLIHASENEEKMENGMLVFIELFSCDW